MSKYDNRIRTPYLPPDRSRSARSGQQRQPTTGPRGCNECQAPAYAPHAPNCAKVE